MTIDQPYRVASSAARVTALISNLRLKKPGLVKNPGF